MSEQHRRGALHLVPLATALALLMIAFAAGTVAARQITHLSNAAVSPRQAAPADVIHFSVLYTDRSATAPKSVTVVIDGAGHAMTRGSGAFTTGVTYSYASKLAVGHHDVVFAAVDAANEKEVVGAGGVWIKAQDDGGSGGGTSGSIGGSPSPGANTGDTPAATPTPKPGTGQAPAPTPAPTSDSDDPGTGQVAAPTPAPTQPSAPGMAATPAPVNPPASAQQPATPDATSAPAAGGLAISRGDGGSGGTGEGAPDNAPAVSVPPVSGGTSDESPRGPLPISSLIVAMAPTLAATSAGASAWAAFVIFGKRRRDTSQPAPDEVLATAAATPVDAAAADGLRPAPVSDESMMPRWRRPSLQAARKNDPLRSVAEAPRLTFGTAPILPLDGFERRQVRYRLVRLLDTPDELYSTEIGLLDQGDEVQLIERHGAYWRVLCPDGRQGWLHRMTLADPVALPSENPERVSGTDTAEVRPDDILDAYLRSRRADDN